jgi:hypothetical protein
MLRSSRIMTVSAAVAMAIVLSILPAAATPPRAGATYTGHIANAPSSQNKVTFHVSPNGHWVRRMHVGPYPLSLGCGQGGPPPNQSSQPAAIKMGKFTAHVVYTGGGKVVARATVTGTFLRRGREKGVVTTHRYSDSCVQSLPYTTHAN